jgi:ABC-type phosphate/phosphonate transport system substrate-binding protein
MVNKSKFVAASRFPTGDDPESGRIFSPAWWVPALLILILSSLHALAQPATATGTTAQMEPIRFGFSRQIFGAVNENDGRAALKAHVQAIGRADAIPMDANFPVFDNPKQMDQALHTGAVDMIALRADEFLELTPEMVGGPLIVAVVRRRSDDEYVLLVRHDGGFGGIAALKGRQIMVLQSPRTPLALHWLDVLTMREGLGPAAQVIGRITQVPKSSRAVLPVFFKQADAALVSRSSFEMMGELNPQINSQIKILAFSRPMVPVVMCFRSSVPQTSIDRVVTAALKMHTTVSGRQVMTIFQFDSLDALPRSCLDSARELLAERARLLALYQKQVPAPTMEY